MPLPALIARIMIAAGAAAVSYLFVKQLGSGPVQPKPREGEVRMILDPHCQTYFPADEAISRQFCSRECALAYFGRHQTN